MRKIFVFLIILSILVVPVGCDTPANNNPSTASIEWHQDLTATELPYRNNWFQADLPKVGLKDIAIGETAEGRFSTVNSTSPRFVHLLCDYAEDGENSTYHDSFLAVETDSKILFKDLSSDNDSGSYGDTLYARDVNGDGIDEIIVQQTVGMTGGAGQHLSRIFKVADDEIQEIFNSLTANLDDAGYDTGFSSILQDGFKLEVQNRFTGYSKTLDLSSKEQYIGVYFDETGKAIGDGMIRCDSFMEFTPEDVNSDGVFEIVCSQYASLYSHADYIGDAKSVLRFNPKVQRFEVIKAEFITE
ncbi:MAG: hypothetical protein FWE94_03300 [Coriobacteriia bacterium]|nr:hypothetical protein [Coriobacteriia bacterium]